MVKMSRSRFEGYSVMAIMLSLGVQGVEGYIIMIIVSSRVEGYIVMVIMSRSRVKSYIIMIIMPMSRVEG